MLLQRYFVTLTFALGTLKNYRLSFGAVFFHFFEQNLRPERHSGKEFCNEAEMEKNKKWLDSSILK
jgi:hypothetical protein